MLPQSQCPSCSKILTLRSSDGFGERVPCPKCHRPFLVTPYTEETHVIVEDYDAFEEDEDVFEFSGIEPEHRPREHRPRKRLESISPDVRREATQSRRPRRKRRRVRQEPVLHNLDDVIEQRPSRRGRGSGMPGWLKRTLYGVGGVAFVGIAIWVILAFLTADKIDFTYLPPNTNAIVFVKVGEAWDAEFLAATRQTPMVRDALAHFEDQLPLKITDIESVTFGAENLSFDQAMRSNVDGVVVARLAKSITIPFEKLGYQSISHMNASYFVASQSVNERDRQLEKASAIWQAEPNVLVIGAEHRVRAAMTQGTALPGGVDRFDFMPKTDHEVFFAFSPVGGLPLQRLMQRNGFRGNLSGLFNSKVKGIFFGAALKKNPNVQVCIDCNSEQQSKAVERSFESLIHSIDRSRWGRSRTSQLREVTSMVKQTFSTVQANKTVTFSATVPQSINAVFGLSLSSTISNLLASAVPTGLNGQSGLTDNGDRRTGGKKIKIEVTGRIVNSPAGNIVDLVRKALTKVDGFDANSVSYQADSKTLTFQVGAGIGVTNATSALALNGIQFQRNRVRAIQ
jgi:hypothetical protein